MTDTYRAMCAELSELDGHCVVDCTEEWADAMCRLRAALAQPEPVAPTDQEIEEWADACPEAPLEEMDPEVHGWRRCFTAKEFGETIRAAIARWGHPTPQPVAKRPTLMERAMNGDATAAKQFLHEAGFTDKQGQWLPQYQPTPEATND